MYDASNNIMQSAGQAIPLPQTASTHEPYERPALIVFGPLIQLAQGSGGDDYDGCSAGHYEAGE